MLARKSIRDEAASPNSFFNLSVKQLGGSYNKVFVDLLAKVHKTAVKSPNSRGDDHGLY